MIDLIYTKNDTPSGLAAQYDEAEAIAGYITSHLIEGGVSLEKAERLAKDVVTWCQTANDGDEYIALTEYGFEIYAYDESISAEKAISITENMKSEDVEPQKAEKERRFSIRDKLQQLKTRQSGKSFDGQERTDFTMEV